MMPDASAPAPHVHPVRVYYEDTDAGGVVYYANYLKYAERGRTEWLRAHGIENGALMRDQRVAFAVRECHADYRKPALLDDMLEVVTRIADLAGASLRMDQDIRRGDEVLVSISVRLACLDIDSGAPRRLPRAVREAVVPGTAGRNPREHGVTDGKSSG